MPMHWPARLVPQPIKEEEHQVLCVCVSRGKDYSRCSGLSDTKQTMRATLEIALLLLAGYLTLTDGVSKLLHITGCNLTHECNDTVGCIFEYNTSLMQKTHLTRL